MATEKDDPRENEEEADAESADQNQEAYQQATSSRCHMPPLDFNTFVLSLSTQALIQLGEVNAPEGEKIKVDLQMARHSIDLLGLLEEKTKGNLTGEEERLLQQVLFDLRMRFVAKCRDQG